MSVSRRRSLLNNNNQGTLANRFARNDLNVVSVDFTDSLFYNLNNPHYGSLFIRDSSNPANYYYGDPYQKITYSSPSAKMVRFSDGFYRLNAHNLYLNSASPANQSVTVVSGATYAVTLTGSVQTTLSGATTGTITAGTTTFTAASSTLTFGSTTGSGTVHVRRTPSESTYIPTGGSAAYALPFEWDTFGNLMGIRCETSRTNLSPHSRDVTGATQLLNNSAVTRARDATGIDGITNSASSLTATSTNASFSRWTSTTDNSAVAVSAFIRRKTGTGPIYFMREAGYSSRASGSETTTGNNLITNGTFASGITSWSQTGNDASNYWDWDGVGAARCTCAAQAVYPRLDQSFTATVGKYYLVTFTLSVTSGTAAVRVGRNGAAGGASFTTNGTYSVILGAPTTSMTVSFAKANTQACVFTIDNVDVREISNLDSTVVLTSQWQRFEHMFTSSGATAPTFIIATSGDAIEIDCVQVEQAEFPSSPIITEAATATRGADSISLSSSLFQIGSGPSTMFCEFTLDNYVSAFGRIAMFFGQSGGSLDNRAEIAATTNGPNFGVTNATVTQCFMSVSSSQPFRVAGSAADNDFQLVASGNIAGSDTSGTVPWAQFVGLWFGSRRFVNNIHGYVRRALFISGRRMTNDQMQALTR